MRRRLTPVIGVLMLGAATLCAAGQQPPATPKPTPTFRSGLDVIAVDVQVIDRNGVPVAGLGPEKFEVTVNGRRRRVLSAELIESRSATSLTPVERATATAGPPVVPTLPRVVFIAIDCLSFDASASRHVIASARAFIDCLPPTDEVGLFAYPYGPKINPTTDHAAVGRSLATVMGQRHQPFTQFHLRPAEIVDLSGAASSSAARESPLLESVVMRECGEVPDDTCRRGLMLEITGAALYYEGQGNAGLGMLRSLLEQLSGINGRKTLVLLSAGMIASDVPGGRPDISELGMQVGKEAARSNTSVYTLFLDTNTTDRFQAQVRGADKNLMSVARDSEILGRWLDQFSGEAGGALFRVQVGSGEYAFDRVLKEISAYYLLGVEPGDEDRDGRTHEIKVKTREKNVVLRGRRWVMVPKRGAAASEIAGAPSPSESAAAKEKPAATTAPGRPGRCPGPGGCLRSGRAGFSAAPGATPGSRDPAAQLPRIGCAVAGRSQTDRGLRARARGGGAPERQRQRARRRRPAARGVQRAPASAHGRRRLRVCVAVDRSGGARGPVHAGQRDAVGARGR